MIMYEAKQYYELPWDDEVTEITIYFKTVNEANKWFCSTDEKTSKRVTKEVETRKCLWHIEIDGEVGCYVDGCDAMRYAEYWSYYGHKVVITNPEEDEP